jgi:hypothetical protein
MRFIQLETVLKTPLQVEWLIQSLFRLNVDGYCTKHFGRMSIRIVVMTQLMIASFDPLQSTARFIL